MDKSLARPVLTLSIIVLLFVVSMFGFTKVPSIFMPPSDRNLVIVDISFPLGTQINITDQRVGLIERFMKDSLAVSANNKEGIIDWASYIGKGPESYDLGYFAAEPNASYAHILINTTSDRANDVVINKLRNFTDSNIFDAEIKISRLVGAGGAEAPLEIRLSGKDANELFRMADRVKTKLFETPGTINVTDDWGARTKKIYVNIDDNRLSQSGLTNQDVALSLLTSLSGFDVGDFREEDKTIPIVMREENSATLSYTDVENLTVFSQKTGSNNPLAQVAEIEVPWQYSKILRRNLKRSISIQSGVKDGYLASEIVETLRPFMKEEKAQWKNGYSYEFGGDAEGNNDAMGAIALNLPLSFFIIILLLVLQFNSFRKASIILLTIPLALVGVTGGLLGVGAFFSFTAFLGIISLAGIIINDAIVLVDKVGTELDNGKPLLDSIKKAANDRFSPILLTTLTTSCGMVPLWTGGGDLWSPMAITMIFGLLFATIILLIFVPVIFNIFFKENGFIEAKTIQKKTNETD